MTAAVTARLTPQEIAEASSRIMLAQDRASQAMGMTLDEIGPGRSVMSMTVVENMTNGMGACHGGLIFTLADSALGFACNSHGRHAVGQHCTMTYLRPGRLGDRLVAIAVMRAKAGRTGIYDIAVVRRTSAGDELIAEFRGQTRDLDGSWV